MSELNHVFRSDALPTEGKEVSADKVLPSFVAKAPSSTPVEHPADAKTQPELKSDPKPEPQASTSEAIGVPTEPDLDFTVHPENLWHPSEIMQQRMTQLSASSQNTSHQLDAHEAVSQRLEKKLGAL